MMRGVGLASAEFVERFSFKRILAKIPNDLKEFVPVAIPRNLLDVVQFFGSHLILGLAGWEDLLIFGLGVTLLVRLATAGGS